MRPPWTATSSACSSSPPDLLALNGLRVSEAAGADIEHLGLERRHRTLVITREGGRAVTIPLAPGTARATDLAIGERTDGPLFLTADGQRLDRHGAFRIVRRVTRRAGIVKHVSPHTAARVHHRRRSKASPRLTSPTSSADSCLSMAHYRG
jgi:integrase